MGEQLVFSSDPANGTEPVARHYSAFISYTNADRAIALRLQARLERYRLPPRLARQVGFDRIKPVFVDRAEMRASADLGGAIREALEQSEFLIVLCTPRTPSSVWVGREIDAFRELRGEKYILVALLEGQTQDCFHSHLLAGRTEDGAEPLAADFRREGDGYRLALLKIVASLVGVNLDDLVQRDERRQRRRLLTAGGASAAIALVISALVFATFRARASAVEQRIEASQAMERQLKDLRAKIKAGGTLDMAAAVNHSVELFYDGQSDTSQLPQVALGRAQLLLAEADDSFQRGKIEAAANDARSAWKISADVLSREPDNTKAIYVHAQSAYWIGLVALLQRDTPLAANAFARYADLADRLVKADPQNPDWLMERGYAYTNLGKVALQDARDPERAEHYLETARAAYREVVKRRPGDLNAIYELENDEALQSGVAKLRGDLDAARRHIDERAKLIGELLKRQPKNRLYLRDHLANELGLARLDAALGEFESALRKLRAVRGEAVGLLAADPQNALVAGQKRAIELFEAKFELRPGVTGFRARKRAEKLLGDCSQDWTNPGYDELAAFCSILLARDSLMRGDKAAARRIMSDERLAKWVDSTSLSTMLSVDFQAECRNLGEPGLCKPGQRSP
jgi:tetratricopeptide (TPR) repeat protein